MRLISLVGAVFLTTGAYAAWADEAPYSQTLDEQLHRVQQGQQAVPGTWTNQGTPVRTTAGKPVGSEIIDSQGSGAIPELPVATKQTDTGMQYLSGGISDEELAQLKSNDKAYNTHFLYSSPNGAYIGDGNLRIVDKSGAEVFAASNLGPYVYVNLPAGSYTATASVGSGASKNVKFTVGKSIVKQNFVFTEPK